MDGGFVVRARDTFRVYATTVRHAAMRLLSSGLTVHEVHQQLGVGQSTLGNWLSRPEGVIPSRECPRCHGRRLDGRAYAYLLGLYLGDGHLAHGRKDVFRLDIACCDDWPGPTEAAVRAVGAHSTISGSPGNSPTRKTISVARREAVTRLDEFVGPKY
jgi:hypothetical protein